jgi:ABC-type lipoprotein export system ATPase subunit
MTSTATEATMSTHHGDRRGGEIRCRGLVRIFATDGVEVQALQGLELDVEPGEVVALVGASGSGKSTLLAILSGLDRPTGGSAVVAGTDLVTMDPRARVAYQRSTVGFVWQQAARNLLPYLTASENVRLPMEIAAPARGAAAAARSARVAELLDMLGVSHVADHRPSQMSGGEQQRVAIAVAMAGDPRVLLADEPTGELDEATSVEVLESLRSVNAATGVTVLVVTHDPAVAEHVARTVRIRDGRTATEVLRRTEVDAEGVARHVAEEVAVLDRVGRLQLPQDVVERFGLRERVRLSLEADHVGVWPWQRHGGDPAPAVAAHDGARREAEKETGR